LLLSQGNSDFDQAEIHPTPPNYFLISVFWFWRTEVEKLNVKKLYPRRGYSDIQPNDQLPSINIPAVLHLLMKFLAMKANPLKVLQHLRKSFFDFIDFSNNFNNRALL